VIAKVLRQLRALRRGATPFDFAFAARRLQTQIQQIAGAPTKY
jgi:hypothetical protein